MAQVASISDTRKSDAGNLPAAPELAGAELTLLYPKPMMVFVWPNSDEINQQLKKVILEVGPGGRRSNVGGWQSSYSFTDWPEPAVKTLVQRAEAMMREMIVRTIPNADERHFSGWKIEGWANVSKYGDFNSPHNHTMHGVLWSGVYYVATDENVGGATHFHDESFAPKEMIIEPDMFSREVSLQPRPGQMVMFPGPLYHYVVPYLGSGHRITVAFNFRNPNYVIPDYSPESFMLRNFRGVVRAREMMAARWQRIVKRIFPKRKRANTAWQQYYTKNHPLLRIKK